jgi:hypothetical protein
MFYTGVTRDANDILEDQARSFSDHSGKETLMHKMVELGEEMRLCLQQGKLDDFGALLHESWKLKRSLSTPSRTAKLMIFMNARVQPVQRAARFWVLEEEDFCCCTALRNGNLSFGRRSARGGNFLSSWKAAGHRLFTTNDDPAQLSLTTIP